MYEAEYIEWSSVAAQVNQPVTMAGNQYTSLIASFERVKSQGAKKPKLRIKDVEFYLAPTSGRNAGYLYVKSNQQYLGKISPEGRFYPSFECDISHKQLIEHVSKQPTAYALEHGKDTGKCACCGRVLTDPNSVAMGIGPVCRERWGL